MEFLEHQQAGSKPTDTITTLHNLLKMKVPLASTRALGIIKCCITGPFQHAFDFICSNIYEMVPYTIKARDSIQAFSVDASSLLEDPQSIYPDIPMDTTEKGIDSKNYAGNVQGWRTGETVDLELEKLHSNSLKRKALITCIQSLKHKDSLHSTKKRLLRTANQSVEQLISNLKELMLYAPLSMDLPDLDADEVTRISGTTVLSPEQRSLLLEERISILQERLLAQRGKLKKSTPTEAADEEDVNEPTPSTSTGIKCVTARKKRSAVSKKTLPARSPVSCG